MKPTGRKSHFLIVCIKEVGGSHNHKTKNWRRAFKGRGNGTSCGMNDGILNVLHYEGENNMSDDLKVISGNCRD